ncbi:Hypothetical_protein [Hexamita inflata]|uniref:Hypothetical_protein n=1 Tax=Hexamita inflata TaxID=28002 RepID=A0AA86PMC2_9EUKA|nr:Hypothetical protein HINF_LOCUS30425 [Hexamita inflata]
MLLFDLVLIAPFNGLSRAGGPAVYRRSLNFWNASYYYSIALGRNTAFEIAVSESSEQRLLSARLCASTISAKHHSFVSHIQMSSRSWTISSKGQPAAPVRKLNLTVLKSSLQNQSISARLPTVWSELVSTTIQIL